MFIVWVMGMGMGTGKLGNGWRWAAWGSSDRPV